MTDKRTKVRVTKRFSYGEKVVYEGILRKARRMIPPSKRDQYTITNLETGETIEN